MTRDDWDRMSWHARMKWHRNHPRHVGAPWTPPPPAEPGWVTSARRTRLELDDLIDQGHRHIRHARIRNSRRST